MTVAKQAEGHSNWIAVDVLFLHDLNFFSSSFWCEWTRERKANLMIFIWKIILLLIQRLFFSKNTVICSKWYDTIQCDREHWVRCLDCFFFSSNSTEHYSIIMACFTILCPRLLQVEWPKVNKDSNKNHWRFGIVFFQFMGVRLDNVSQ